MKKTIEYYDATASEYDELHGGDRDPEHIRALEIGWPIIELMSPSTLLDVGCGTGRSLRWVFERSPSITLLGIEPSTQLLELARTNIPAAKIGQGDGERLEFKDRGIDIVIASGIMHHVDRPSYVINEMFRVANKAVLISDHNNFAFGGPLARRLRMLLRCTGLLGAATFIKHGLNKQGYSEGDGWWYPYSIMDNFGQISSLSERLYIFPTRSPTSSLGGNILFSQSHLAFLAVKQRAFSE